MTQAFEWERMLLGEDLHWLFVFEVMLRTVIMFLVMMIFFRLSGKREIKQINIYDLIIIVGLGSAAGDPMFYDDVPLLHGLAVFVTILSLYTLITWLTQKNHRLDTLLEGDTRCVMSDNTINARELKKESLPIEELWGALRREKVSQLGQVDRVYIEASGQFSIFLKEDKDVVPGLPLFPEEMEQSKKYIEKPGTYCCLSCGYTKEFPQAEAQPVCKECGGLRWLPAVNRRRIT